MKAVSVLFAVAAAEQPSFEEWAGQYGFNAADDAMKAKYEANVADIEAWNADPEETATFGVNQFSGLTQEEFKAQYLTRSSPSDAGLPVLGVHEWDGSEAAADVDWSTKGAVTDIKDQGSCGGCWSFAATGGLEGAKYVSTGQLTSLSEQQFLDCDKTDKGCGGGLEYDGWNYFKSHNSAICTESSYPYKGRNGACKSSSCQAGIPAGGIKGVSHVSKSANSLMSAVQQQPISVGVDAGAWQSYRSGILTKKCGRQLDHSVLLVGYSQGSYWKIKNSWGRSWGENGFIRLTTSGDQCGVYDDASYPTISAAVAV
jgi:cathepsin L